MYPHSFFVHFITMKNEKISTEMLRVFYHHIVRGINLPLSWLTAIFELSFVFPHFSIHFKARKNGFLLRFYLWIIAMAF